MLKSSGRTKEVFVMKMEEWPQVVVFLNVKSKYLIISIVVSVIGIILFTNSYFHVKERVRIPQKVRKPGEPSTLSRIFKCKPLMLVVAMGVLSSGRYMVQAAAVHVARYAFYIGPDLTGMTLAERTAAIDASVSSVKTIF